MDSGDSSKDESEHQIEQYIECNVILNNLITRSNIIKYILGDGI